MSDREIARDKAARLLKKPSSASSLSSSLHEPPKPPPISRLQEKHKKPGSMSTISFADEPMPDENRPLVQLENTYQMGAHVKFPDGAVKSILQDTIESYLSEERYEPELCRQMTKTISDVVKARVKDLIIPRYKVICLIHIGQLNDQALRMGSRCLWDASCDTFSSFEYRNNSLFAVGMVYGVHYE